MARKIKKGKEKKQTYTCRKTGLFARAFRLLVTKILVRKMSFIFHDGAPSEPSVLVGNHTKFLAPLAVQYLYPGKVRTWSNGKLIDRKTCYDMLKNETIKGIKGEWLYKLLLPILAPLMAYYFRVTLNCIPVYHDLRVRFTFQESVRSLENGAHIAIFPEQKKPAINEILCPFASGFAYLAYNYYNETGKILQFYPVYCALSLKQTHVGTPIAYDPEVNIKEQSAIISDYLVAEITKMARSLPPHKIAHVLNDFKIEQS